MCEQLQFPLFLPSFPPPCCPLGLLRDEVRGKPAGWLSKQSPLGPVQARAGPAEAGERRPPWFCLAGTLFAGLAGHTLTVVFPAPEGRSNLCHLAAGSLKSRPD